MKEMLVALLAFGLVFAADAFYLPGVAPQDFKRKDVMYLKVNKLSSIKNQLPYEYYSLPYCRPEKIVQSAENLGEVLRGDRIENSLYQVQALDSSQRQAAMAKVCHRAVLQIQMRVDEQCKFLCRIDSLSSAQAKAFRLKIEDDYRVNMILDNLPVAMVKMRKDDKSNSLVKTYERGFPVGFKASLEGQSDIKYFLHNHLRFTILYHKDAQTDLARIVGFEVEPFSVKHEYEAPWDKASPVLNTCNPGRAISVTHDTPPQPVLEGTEAIFTYDVRFVASDIRWASRWDTYLLMIDDQIHWFSIINSVMIVLFLTGMVAVIMLRVLRRDISNYNQLESGEDAQEETGWKLVHGDVFRPPAAGSILASYVGTGVQLFGMALVTMIFALLGFLSPANRGGLMTAMLMMFVFMGMFAGYFSARLYKSFRGEEWKKTTLRTALLFPGVCFVIFFFLNMLIWGQKSSGAVPFGTLFALCFLWFGISVPLVFVGSYFGYKKPAPEEPVRTNKIPRQIPEQPWYMNPVFSCLVGGVLPFGAVFIELFFILTSMWLQQKDGPGWWSLLVVTDLSWLWPYDVTSVACMQQKDGTKAGGHGSGPAWHAQVAGSRAAQSAKRSSCPIPGSWAVVKSCRWLQHQAPGSVFTGTLPMPRLRLLLLPTQPACCCPQFYYLFGFLALVFLILIITCAEITIVLCYFQLCSEDYHWWWRAYFTSGTSALYLFAYSGFYFYSKLDITKTVPMLMYFGYMLMVSFAFFCLTGTIGFYACYIFVRKIYSAVKID
ncbi:hypothetical protein QJQ45_013398 [Haematococcus lacustris]|nr:hypothetical protein QJQ45_013398 [Haematococcus lacustris]